MGCQAHGCLATLLTILTAMLLIGAVAAPWYFIHTEDIKTGERNTLYIWWQGFYYQNHADASAAEETGWLKWAEVQSMHPKDLYMFCVTLSVLSLFSSLVLGIAVVLTMSWDSTREPLQEAFGAGNVRRGLLAMGYAMLVMVMGSWMIFMLLLPRVLSGATLCSAQQNRWCSAFAGRFHDAEETAVWFPFIGWICAFVATLPSLVLVVLFQLIRVPKEPAPEFDGYQSLEMGKI